MSIPSAVAWFGVSAVVAGFFTEWFRKYALRQRLLDVPNARSSHQVATPRGGGVAVVVVIVLATLAVATVDPTWTRMAVLLALAGTAVAFIGFVDDRRGVAASYRISVHAIAVGLLLFATNGLGPLSLPFLPESPAVQLLAASIALLWLLNLFNFMDGIDGIAAIEAAFFAGALAVCLQFGPGASGSLLALCLVTTGAALGFLKYNWPPARIFLGDVGSGFLGLMLGALAVVSHRESNLSVWVPTILLGVFVTDATLTLVTRMTRGERWYDAHRSHAYQRLSRRLGRHLPVTIGVLAVNVVWLFPLALAATRWPELAAWFFLLAYAPLVLVAIRVGAGQAEELERPE